MLSKSEKGLRLLYVKKPGPFDAGRLGEKLPEAYRKFWNEWRVQKPEPVHYIPEPGKLKRNPETGEVKPVQNIHIPLKFPPESEGHLWGGEAVVMGFQKRTPLKRRVPHFWVPIIERSVVYSEILDTHMSVILTQRTLQLIHKNYGFDHYILKTAACDLRSDLAVKIKRRLLLALHNQDLYPDNPEKKQEVYKKYEHYLSTYSKEDAEWYGLTYKEACQKLVREEEKRNQPQPLKLQYRQELLQQLLERGIEAGSQQQIQQTSSWLSKMNPFGSKQQGTSVKT